MAYTFSGSSQYLFNSSIVDSSAIVLGDMSAAFTITTDTTAAGFAAAFICQAANIYGDPDTDPDQNTPWFFGRNGAELIAFHENGAGVNNIVTLPSGTFSLSTGTVYRVCVRRDVSATSYQWTVNGTTYAAVTSGYNSDPTGGANSRIGVGFNNNDSTPSQEWDGTIEMCAMWDTLLSQAEAEAYTNGAHPLTISPSNLKLVYPLDGSVSPEKELILNHRLTATGATVVDSQPWRYPARRWRYPVVAAGTGTGGAQVGSLVSGGLVNSGLINGGLVQ